MKIITWNMGYWQFTKYHDHAWDFLRRIIQPDIALLQEIKPPNLDSSEDMVFVETHKGWGIAVYSKILNLSPLVYESRYSNRVAIARVAIPNSIELDVASIHAPIIDGRVFPHLENIVADIEECLDNRTAVIGGDFNSARLAETVWPGYGHGPFFEKMDNSRFINCCWALHGKELQTYFRKGLVNPFQDDHLFISRNILSKLRYCNVVENGEIKKYSDHIPLMMELDLD